MIGKTISHYEITELLGKGGMGEVYRAHDTKLDRDVALKMLPLDLATEPERLARFRREAKLLASLNHPNIAGIHGLEESEGQHFLVMELAEGEDLSDRIKRGPLPIDEVLEISRQIAEGLEEAHENGIVHRDLKPGNIRLTPDGKVKILDFGLARAFVGETVDEQDLHNSPTITAAMTQQGVILGTAAYMSPEQAKGKTVDRRADLWSFGVILWEMLTGQRLFSGETISDTLAAVLRAEPPYEELPDEVPPAVRRLLERCLERDPRKRLRDVGEARIRLERWQSDPASMQESSISMMAVPVGPSWHMWLPWGIALFVVLFGVSTFLLPGSGDEQNAAAPMTLEIQLEDQARLQEDTATNVIVSPSGKEIAYLGAEGIYLRRLDQRTTRILPGTESALIACYSPDEKWIAFISGGKLRRISVTGGSPIEICDAPDSRGITWVNESTLVFNPTFAGGLHIVSLADGIAHPLTELDETKGERSHRWPHALPDGKSVFYMNQLFGRDYDEGDIVWMDIETKERRTIYRGGASPRYVETGHLLFARDSAVFAIPVDLASGKTRGLAVPVIDEVWTSVGDQDVCDGSAQFDFSRNGVLLYREAFEFALESQLAWFDMATGALDPIGEVQYQMMPLLSPDARYLALMRGERSKQDIYIIDLESDVESRLTFEDNSPLLGCWSPDSRWIYYTHPTPEGDYILYRKAAHGSGSAEILTQVPDAGTADCVSPDGRWLYLTVWMGSDAWDIHRLDLSDPEAVSEPVVTGPETQYLSSISPAGDWLLYGQTQGDTWYVYVRRVEDTGGRWEIHRSHSQHQHLLWSHDGRTVYTRDREGIHAIELEFARGGVQTKAAHLLQREDFVQSAQFKTSDMLADGTRAIVMLPPRDRKSMDLTRAAPIVLVTEWFDELNRKAPTTR